MEASINDAFPASNHDVPDSTDWLGTPLASLMPVEQAFRCHVCKDFYNSPMLTSCNHTFCSLCIRRCLSVEGKCPLCRMSDQDSKLRGNWALREAVDAFTKARPAILSVARNPPVVVVSQSPKRKAMQDGMEESEPQAKRTRTSARLSKTRAAEATAVMAQEEAGLPGDNDGADYELDDGLVACPICQKRMKDWQVDKHLDTSCSGVPQQRTTSRPIQTGFGSNKDGAPAKTSQPLPERLPSLSYSLLNDNALRKKLAALGISTNGPRQLLERRHKEWITIWNANCDSAHPKRRADLLHDLDVWERTLGGRAPVASRAANVGAQIKDKDFDGAAWSARHDTSFKDLIANARKSRSKAEQRKPSTDTATDSGPSSDPGLDQRTVTDLAEKPSSQTQKRGPEVVNAEIIAPINRAGMEREKSSYAGGLSSTTAIDITPAGGDARHGVDETIS